MHFFRLQLLGARALGDVGDRAAQAEQVLLVGVLDDRHDQPAVERDGDAEVDVLLVDDVVAVERGVDERMPAERVDDRLGDERHVGQLRAAPLVVRLLLLADPLDGREVDVEDRVHVRRRAPAEHHVLGDLPAHHRQRLDLDALARLDDAGPGRSGRRARIARPSAARRLRVRGTEDVVLRHAAADAGAVNLRDVDVVLLARSAGRAATTSGGADRPSSASVRRLRCRWSRGGRGAGAVAAAAASIAATPSPRLCAVRRRGCARRPAAGARRAGRRRRRPAPIVADDAVDRRRSRPPATVISVSTPAAGDGISASTLSVEISNSGSSRSTGSPTFLIQRTIVPSAIDSPIWGITTGVGIVWADPVRTSASVTCESRRRARRAPPRPPPRRTSGARGSS